MEQEIKTYLNCSEESCASKLQTCLEIQGTLEDEVYEINWTKAHDSMKLHFLICRPYFLISKPALSEDFFKNTHNNI